MSTYDVRCLNCLHGSHEGKECPYCPQNTKENPNARCKDFTRPDLFAARCLGRIEQQLSQGHGQLMTGLSVLFDLVNEAFPEAGARLEAKIAEQQKKSEEALIEHQKKMEVEAADALRGATCANEERFKEGLVEEYTNNVVPFPTKTVEPKELA